MSDRLGVLGSPKPHDWVLQLYVQACDRTQQSALAVIPSR